MALPLDVDGTYVNDPTVLYSAGELRLADAALVSQAGIANGLAVSVDGSDVVTVTAGSVVISGESAVAGTGVYRAGIGAAVTGALTARNATNARIDVVVFRQLDSDVVPAHAAKKAQVAIITGTPSATPAVPTIPSMAVELARITVPATGGGAATVDSSFRTSALGVGVVPSTFIVRTRSTDQVVATGSQVQLSFDATERSAGAWTATGGQVVIPATGLYAVSASLSWASSATGRRHLELKSGTTSGGTTLVRDEQASSATGAPTNTISDEGLYLTAGQTVSLWVFQTSGGNLSVQSSTPIRMVIRRVA